MLRRDRDPNRDVPLTWHAIRRAARGERTPIRMLRRVAAALLLTHALPLHVTVGAASEAELPEIPSRFADAAAVVLEDSGHWVWKRPGRADLTATQRILIRDREAFDLADQQVLFDAEKDGIRGFEARTIPPDGPPVPVEGELVHESVLFQAEGVDLRALRFTFPAVTEGAVIEWTYTLRQKKEYPPINWEVQRSLPVLHSDFSLRIEAPMGTYARIQAVSRAGDSPLCNVWNGWESGDALMTITCRDVPAFEAEPLAPPDADQLLGYEVNFGSFHLASLATAGWDYYRESLYGVTEEFLSKDGAVAALAGELVTPDMSDAEKVDAIHGFVAGEIEIDDFGEGLTTADEVLEGRSGSATDAVLLTLGLLRRSGIRADPVLVADRSEQRFVFDMWPTQARYLMLRATLDGHDAFLDPACRFCAPGVLDWRFCSREPNAVVIDAGRSEAIATGEVAAQYNSEIRAEEVHVTPDGLATLTGQATYGGQYEVERRTEWEELTEAARRRAFLREFATDFDETDVTFSEIDNMLRPLTVEYDIAALELARTADGRVILRPTDWISPGIGIPLTDRREQPVWFAYRFTRQAKTTFHLPDGMTPPDTLPERTHIDAPGLEFKSMWSRDGQGGIVWQALLTVDRTLIPAREYTAARRFVLDVRSALRQGIPVVTGDGP
jgi:hypothetical protein